MILDKSPHKLFLYGLLILLLFFGLATIVSSSGGKFMQLELAGFILLLILTLVAFFNYSKPHGEFYFYFLFLFYTLNLIAIWYVNQTFYLSLTFLAIAGFFFSIPNKNVHKQVSTPKSTSPKVDQKHTTNQKQSSVEKSIPLPPTPSRSFIFEEKVIPSKKEPPLKKELIKKEKVDTNTIFTNFAQPKEIPPKETNNPFLPSKPTPSQKPNPTVKYNPGKYVASKRSNTYHEPRCEWAKKINPTHQLWFKAKEEAWEKGYKAHDCVR